MNNATLPLLPIPPLEETIERYLNWVRPLVTDEQWTDTQKLSKAFLKDTGSTLQQDLVAFAEEHSDTSWLNDAWFEGYLGVREAPPLSTSGGFMVQLDLPRKGLPRLAHFIHGFAELSAQYLAGELPASESNRGEPLDMSQWKILQGMARIPKPHCDEYTFADKAQQMRYAVVFWQDLPFLLPVLDEAHRPYPVEQLAGALQNLIEQPITAIATSFTAVGLAGADRASELLEQISTVAVNKTTLDYLNHSLLHIHLVNDFGDDHDETLNAYSFLADNKLWAYKPMTVGADFVHPQYYLHIEHSPYDGGAIQSIIERIEKGEKMGSQLPQSSQSIDLPLQVLEWDIPAAIETELAQIQETHSNKAQNYRTVTVDAPLPEGTAPKKISHDALMQLVMQYAQLTTFGCIRNTYESVDVSHYQAGRTECIRPVSVESVVFTQALHDGTATEELLHQAVNEHKNRIKACKRGHGVNRHLYGLQLMADKRGISPEFFADAGYTLLSTDQFSTSSLGNRWYIGDFSFAPTAAGGLGVSYFTIDTGYWFCISYTKDLTDKVREFSENLKIGCHKLYALL